MERWHERVALVTGASSGIGAAICRALVKSGMKVVGAARGVDRIKDIANELRSERGSLLAVKCDLTKDEEIYALFNTIKENYGGVDICVNNAGMSFNKSLLDGCPQEWRTMMDVNVIALCLCTKLAVASMQEREIDDGHILNINSTSGHRVTPTSTGTIHFYDGAKHAVRAISEGLRQELRHAKSHIRVSCISPGFVGTEFALRMLEDAEAAEKLLTSIVCIQADDIASTALHVISSPPHVEINDVIMRPTEQLI